MRTSTVKIGPDLVKYVGSSRGLFWSGSNSPAVGVYVSDTEGVDGLLRVHYAGGVWELPLSEVKQHPVVRFAGYGPQYRVPLAHMREVRTGNLLTRGRGRKRPLPQPSLFGGAL